MKGARKPWVSATPRRARRTVQRREPRYARGHSKIRRVAMKRILAGPQHITVKVAKIGAMRGMSIPK